MRARKRSSAPRRLPAALALGPALTIAEVGPTHRKLGAMLEAGAALADASALQSIDTAGLQLLLVAAKAAQQRGLKLKVIGAERLLCGAAGALGLDGELAATLELS